MYTFDGSGWSDASDGLPTADPPETRFGPLAFGDLDNDGNLDLVGLKGYTTGSWPKYYDWTDIYAWLGDGNGQWTELSEIETDIPGWPQSVTLADIDHNNYLDIIISSDRDDYEPGGISVYKETTPAEDLNIIIRQPEGGEVYINEGVRIITWTSSLPNNPATVTLQYSSTGNQGPWTIIIDNTTDSNYYQWIIPTVFTCSGFIKATVYSNGESNSTVNLRPFIIYDGSNYPPQVPINPNPPDKATDVNVTTTILSWTCSDPEGYPLTYDVYLEAYDPTPDLIVSEGQTQNTYDPGTLQNKTTYYWQIVASDNHGAYTASPIWQFTTEGLPHNPPNAPTITGPANGKVGTSYEYTFTSIDPDGDDIAEYTINWGDGPDENIIGPFASGAPQTKSHTWTSQGTFIIKAKAKDVNGLVGPEGTKTVTIPRNKIVNRPLLNFLENHPNLFPILRLRLQR